MPVTGLRDFLVKGLLVAVRGITRLCDRHHQGAVINEKATLAAEQKIAEAKMAAKLVAADLMAER